MLRLVVTAEPTPDSFAAPTMPKTTDPKVSDPTAPPVESTP